MPTRTIAAEQRPRAKTNRLRTWRAIISARSRRKEHAMSTPNNYAPPQSVVADISSTDTPYEKATRLSRLGAVLLDGLILGIPLMPSYFAQISTMVHANQRTFNYFTVWAAMARSGIYFYLGVLIDLVLIVITTILVYRNAQTIGKKLLGIKVARTDGSRATLARIFWLRYLVNSLIMWVPFLGSLYFLVDSCVIFGEQRRCVHDYIADTIVIRA
jgi:uncharacterized RDD family membrane protein YckC